MFVTCLPPRYSPQIDTNEKSCSFPFGTFRSISQLKISIKFHNTVLHVRFSLSLLFCLCFTITIFCNNVEKKNPTDNKLQTRPLRSSSSVSSSRSIYRCWNFLSRICGSIRGNSKSAILFVLTKFFPRLAS